MVEEVYTCEVCGVKIKEVKNQARHRTSKYHRIVLNYKKIINDLIQKQHLNNS